jgi:hypothetical protein
MNSLTGTSSFKRIQVGENFVNGGSLYSRDWYKSIIISSVVYLMQQVDRLDSLKISPEAFVA